MRVEAVNTLKAEQIIFVRIGSRFVVGVLYDDCLQLSKHTRVTDSLSTDCGLVEKMTSSSCPSALPISFWALSVSSSPLQLTLNALKAVLKAVVKAVVKAAVVFSADPACC